jgi:hypothetical protein
MSDKINVAKCPSCGKGFKLPFPLMYTNSRQRFAVWWEPVPDPQIDEDTVGYKQMLGTNNYLATAPRIKDWYEFKETILITSTVRIPQSSHTVSVLLNDVLSELNCAIGYINNFVTPDPTLPAGQLSSTDKNVIAQAVNTITHWGVLCEQGVSIALATSPDIIAINTVNTALKQKTGILTTATTALSAKFALLNTPVRPAP